MANYFHIINRNQTFYCLLDKINSIVRTQNHLQCIVLLNIHTVGKSQVKVTIEICFENDTIFNNFVHCAQGFLCVYCVHLSIIDKHL